MEPARLRRGFEKSKITRIKNYLTSHPLGTEFVTIHHYQCRLDLLVEAYNSFKQFHNNLTEYIQVDNEEEIEANENYFLYVKEMFSELENELLKNISILSSPVSMDETNAFDDIRSSVFQALNIKTAAENTIPHFSGDYRDWSSFYDIFSTSIHSNQNLSDVQKLLYLNSLLKGEASTSIKHFAITDFNYSLAWNKLILRYGKQTRTINSVVSQTQSYDVSKSIHPISSSTSSVSFIEIQNSSISTNYSKSSNSNHNKSNNQNTVHNQSSTLINCIVCSGEHAVSKCSTFKKFNISFRCDFAQNNNLCFNCLDNTHFVAECNINSSCQICNNRHHTIVHTDSSPSCLISTFTNSSSYESTSNIPSSISNSSQQYSPLPATFSGILSVQPIPVKEFLNSENTFPLAHNEVVPEFLTDFSPDNNLVMKPSLHKHSKEKIYNQHYFSVNFTSRNSVIQSEIFNIYSERIHRFREFGHHRPKLIQRFQSTHSKSTPRTHLLIIHENKDIEVISSCLANWKYGGIKLIVCDISSGKFILYHLCFSSFILDFGANNFFIFYQFNKYDDSKQG